MSYQHDIEEQLKNKNPYEKINILSFRRGISIYNDWIWHSDAYAWKDENNKVWYQLNNEEPTNDYSLVYLRFLSIENYAIYH